MKRLSVKLSDENYDKIVKAKKLFSEKTFNKALNRFIEEGKVEL